MGTRNLTCVVINNEYKLAQYGQWDGYPSGQGVTALEFLHHLNEENALDTFKDIITNHVYEVSDEAYKQYWVDAGADPDAEWVGMDVSDKFNENHPALNRSTGAKILSYIYDNNGGEIKSSLDFAANSLFCEWCYVIDLDKNTFEVYKGFSKEPLIESDRFFFLNEKSDNDYDPVKLLAEFSLHDLPSSEDFIKQLERRNEDDE
jgi:hypothetical protein